MHDAGELFQIVAHRALDGDAVAVPPPYLNTKQFIEGHVLGDVPKISKGQGNTLYHRGMKLQDKVVVVTGGGNGIGRALCRRFAAEGAKAVVVADIEIGSAREVAAEIGGWEMEVDVASESDVQMLVDDVLKKYGRID